MMKTLKYTFLIVLFLPMLSCEKEDFYFLRKNSKVLFISRRIENSAAWNLFRMNNDGSSQEKITELTVRCEKPIDSNSGKTVLFVHYTQDNFYELYTVNIDGTGLSLIDRANRYCGAAGWSLDDTKIIYTKNRNESTDDKDIIVYDLLSEQKDTLTEVGNNTSPSFSPGNQIVYCHQLDEGSNNIYLMNIDGSDKQMIIANAGCPVFSPDGQRIAYLSSIDNGSSQIFVADYDGENPKQLTTSFSSRIWPGWPPEGNYNPQWTPNSKKIVYVSCEDEDPEIHIMNSDGSNKVKLTNTDARDEGPEITTDGKFILFSSKRNMDMNSEIFMMKINGKNQKPLSNYSGSDIYPVAVR